MKINTRASTNMNEIEKVFMLYISLHCRRIITLAVYKLILFNIEKIKWTFKFEVRAKVIKIGQLLCFSLLISYLNHNYCGEQKNPKSSHSIL